MGYRSTADSRKNYENLSQGTKFHTFSDRNARQGGYTRTPVPGNAGVSREFRVVRDNRVNQNTTGEPKPALQQGCSEQCIAIVTQKGYNYFVFFLNFSLLRLIYVWFQVADAKKFCSCFITSIYRFANSR